MFLEREKAIQHVSMTHHEAEDKKNKKEDAFSPTGVFLVPVGEGVFLSQLQSLSA